MNDLPPRKNNGWNIKELILFVAITLAIVLPIRFFIAQPFVVNGTSMSPTFETGQYLIVDQVSYELGDPVRGDVIVFRFPQDKKKFFIKRIIGLPGETVNITGNDLMIDDVLTTEPFVEFSKETNLSITLADDEYFVMGDNRAASLDSRVWGPLKKDFIVGRAFLRLLPVDEAGYMPGDFDF